jgi:hypothetical protein
MEEGAMPHELERLLLPREGWVGEEPGQVGLDDWAHGPEGFMPGVIGLEIEGAELSALELRRVHVHHQAQAALVQDALLACGKLPADHGYRPRVVSQRRPLPDHRPSSHNRWLNADGRDVATTSRF